jgi:signal transduction histidine kinase
MPAIRWRIGLSVFLLVAALQAGVSVYLLERLEQAQRVQLDDDLHEEILELSKLTSQADIALYVHGETTHNTQWDEDFFEIRDEARGTILVRSGNVPEEGLGPPIGARILEPHLRGDPEPGVFVWERPHPNAGDGTLIRVAEMRRGDQLMRTAESLRAYQRSYATLRFELLLSLLSVSLLGAVGAWWVARRSLAPIHAITERARMLRGSSAGSLPRTGTGDEVDRLADVLNDMLARIRSEVQHVRRVSADAAHTLRTPLAAIRGTLEVHIERLRRDEKRSILPALEVLDDTIRLVNRLLLLERIESSALRPEGLQDVHVDLLARDIVETLQPVADERRLELTTSITPVAITRGDPAQLRTALLNLLENALRHTPAGGRIHVTVRPERGGVALIVEDSGPGLRPDQIERVFERFYSEREDGMGSGIGLPIARAIAHAHGGWLSASSPGGARFELHLPVSADRKAQVEA